MTLKKSENNGTEEIGLVTPTPGQHVPGKERPPSVIRLTDLYFQAQVIARISKIPTLSLEYRFPNI